MQQRFPRAEDGFTLIEVLVAAAVLMIGVLGSMALYDRANKTTVENRAREGATNLAREVTEAARAVQYDRIEPSTLQGIIAAQPGLEDANGGTPAFEIQRRGFTYLVALESCIMDDPRDGGGDASVRPATGFCAGSVAPGTPTPGAANGAIDRNPEDYKRVTVRVSWATGSRTRTVSQEVLVNNPGSAAGPAVRVIKLLGHTQPVITSDTQTQVRVQFETSYKPATTNWLIDGSVQTPKPVEDGSIRTFAVDWNFAGLEDGTYVVGAEAYDRYGVAGPMKSLSVLLNRFAPKPPTGLVGGRNGGVVELEWNANLEGDLTGYTVMRHTGSGATKEICDLQPETSCTDADPPAEGADEPVRYFVYAWDVKSDGSPRSSAPSDGLTLQLANTAPPEPREVSVVHRADGTALLRWKRPLLEGDEKLRFYRVYRDGKALSNRYSSWFTPAEDVEFVDGETGGVPHPYWVTSVDEFFLESRPILAQPTTETAP
jgi:type II secretory pathway pseudopilin PulG